jgi:hypothetical protein
MEPLQKGALRGHKNPITCTAVFKDHKRNCNTLVTSDNEGWVAWWNISTKRPLGVWRAHSNSILSVLQIDHSLLLTHGKDSCVRIWVLDQFQGFSKTFSAEDHTDSQSHRWPEYVEIPVNTLNFCNVCYLDGKLITPATQDSNNFDIYSIFPESAAHLPDIDLQLSLRRIVANADPLALHKKAVNRENASNGIEFEISDENSKRDGFGIMMKVVFVSPTLFYIGYESGHIIGFSLTEHKPNVSVRSKEGSSKSFEASLINKDPSVEVVYFSAFHCPHPITALFYQDKLYAGSAGKRLSVHTKQTSIAEEPVIESHNLKIAGVQDITLLPELAVVAFWNGVVKGYEIQAMECKNEQHELKPAWKMSRDVPRISTLESNNGQKESQELPSKVKANTLCILENSTVSHSNYRDLVRARQASPRLLAVGYADGVTIMYEI